MRSLSRTFLRREDGALACEECEGAGKLATVRGDSIVEFRCPDCHGSGARGCEHCGAPAVVAVARTKITGRRRLSLECLDCSADQAAFDGALPEREVAHV